MINVPNGIIKVCKGILLIDQVLYAALAYETRAEVIGEATCIKAVVTLGTRNF